VSCMVKPFGYAQDAPVEPSAERFSLALGSVVKRRSAMWSVSTRLNSSGMVRSKDRSPASTWATLTPSFAAVSAQATAEFTSPTVRLSSRRSHDHRVWPVLQQHRLEGQHDAGRLLRMAAGAHAQVDIWLGQLQVLEEHLRHVVVVMLAGAD